MVRKISIVLMILLLVSMVGCGVKTSQQTSTTPPEPGITDDTITIGASGPASGTYAAYVGIFDGMGAYYNKVNEEGGINGRKIKYVFYDDAYDPSKTVGTVKRLVEEDKVFMLSVGGANCSLAVSDYLAEKKVPLVPAITAVSKILTYKNAFEFQPSYQYESASLAKYAVEKMGGKKIAVWYQNDDYGKEELEGIKAELKKSGLEPVAAIPYNISDVDLSGSVLKLKDLNPDVVIMITMEKLGANFLKEAAKLGLAKSKLLTSGMMYKSIATLAGPAAEGVIFGGYLPFLDDISDQKIKAFQDFAAKYLPGKTPSQTHMLGYSYALIQVEALKRAGKDLTRQKLIDALENMKGWDGGLLGSISFSPTQHGFGGDSIYYSKMENGNFVKIK